MRESQAARHKTLRRVSFPARHACVSIVVDRQAGKQVFATIVQPDVMLPAQPSHLERVAIIVMVSIRLETSADLASQFRQLAALKRWTVRCARYFSAFWRRQFACRVSVLRLRSFMLASDVPGSIGESNS